MAGANSLVVWKFKSNNKTTRCCDPYLETMHGMQNASFASRSEQPPQSMFYTVTFFASPNSVFQCSSNVFICKTRTCETSMDELITSQTVLRCRDLNILCFLNYYCMFWTYVINEGHSFQILTVATPQKLFKTISNSGHSWRHGQTWLISHQEFDTRFAGTSTTSLFEMS